MNIRSIACVALSLLITSLPKAAISQDEQIPWEVTEAAIEHGDQAKKKLLLEWSQQKAVPQETGEVEVVREVEKTVYHQPATPLTNSQPRKRSRPTTVNEYSCSTPWRIALTFDDGPFPHYTPAILDVLREKRVRATFFLVGQQIKAHPGIVRRIHEDGHEIALHSYSHPDMSKISKTDQAWEMDRSISSLYEVLPGVPPTWWRAPYGVLTDIGVRAGRDMGMEHLGWSLDTQDWRRPSISQFLDTVLIRARDGDVVLMHDHSRTTRQALGSLIDELHYYGFEMRTASDLSRPGCPRIADVETPPEPAAQGAPI